MRRYSTLTVEEVPDRASAVRQVVDVLGYTRETARLAYSQTPGATAGKPAHLVADDLITTRLAQIAAHTQASLWTVQWQDTYGNVQESAARPPEAMEKYHALRGERKRPTLWCGV